MSKFTKKLILFLILSTLYQYLFWKSQVGLNLLLFHFILSAGILWLEPQAFRSYRFLGIYLSSFLSLMALVLYYSSISFIAYFTSLWLLSAYIYQPEFKNIYLAAAQSFIQTRFLWNRFYRIPRLVSEALPAQSAPLNQSVRIVRLSLIPLIIGSLFFLIYLGANPIFAQNSQLIIDQFGYALQNIGAYFSLDRSLFTLFGLLGIALFIFQKKYSALIDWERKMPQIILRKRRPKLDRSIPWNTLALKAEFQSAIILLILVNLLLFTLNATDFYYVWLNFDPKTVENMTLWVHEGTYLLILSILLAMGIILYHFRANLNFYPNKAYLENLGKIWLLQNAFLSLSLGLKTFYYIHYNGLAYKRIGVLIFLILCLYGLFTLAQKVKWAHSSFYLIQRNSTAAYLMLICMALVDWDVLIVTYNLEKHSPTGQVDSFVMSRAPKTLSLIHQFQVRSEKARPNSVPLEQKEYLNRRVQYFLEHYPQQDWRSWNYAEYKNFQYFQKIMKQNN